MKKCFLFFMACCCCLMASAQHVEVAGKVDDANVAVGNPFDLKLHLKVPYGYYVEWNDFANDVLSDQIDIVKRGPVVRTADADSNVVVDQTLTLMTFDTGVVQVPSVALSYARSFDATDRLQAHTDPLDLFVTTITVDTTQAYRPIVAPLEAPVRFKEVFPWLLAFVLLVLLGVGVWWYLKRRKTKIGEAGVMFSKPTIPPYTKAIDDLENLRQQKLWQSGKMKEYYSTLTDIAREYIEGQFGVNAVEMTTDDILEEVKPLRFGEQLYGKLKDTFALADLVKFAKYTASSLESDTAMNNMTDFVNESYAHYQDMKAKEAQIEEMKKKAAKDAVKKEGQGNA